MVQFQVDPEVLGEAANRLERHRHRITEITAPSAIGELGDGRVVAQVQATESRIARELGEATEAVAGMARVLRQAGQVYRAGDEQVRLNSSSTVSVEANR